jgi:hypothetical protein
MKNPADWAGWEWEAGALVLPASALQHAHANRRRSAALLLRGADVIVHDADLVQRAGARKRSGDRSARNPAP